MTLRVNGRVRATDVKTVGQLMEELSYPADASGIAVALNGAILPRGQWSARALVEGDEIDIVGAVQGG